ncbi:hypothetical protein [Isobaculum melis]|uniref:ABC-2 family transporter protein n=1 Tax=Isobaculum melis TaxID=142588 RepID=A0A1H9TDG0_9LACT|nr:hypothetical protein [Isobaculum melis]SER94653.1 hypothetical protein SAMN04488559_11222 [Isobaculum melis]
MRPLLRADFYRLRLSKSYWIGLAAILLIVILGTYTIQNVLNTTNRVSESTTITEETYLKQYLFQTIKSYPSAYEENIEASIEQALPDVQQNKVAFFINMMQTDTLTMVLFYLVVITGFLYGDFSSKSIKNTLLYTGSRWIYFLEKWLFGALVTFSVLTFFHLMVTFTYPIAFGENPLNFKILLRTFQVILAQFPIYLAIHSFAFSVFFLVYKRWATVLITGFVSILLPIYLAAISDQVPALRQFNPFNLFNTIGYFSKETMLTASNLFYGVTVSLLYSLIFLVIGWYGFTKFEIKK